MKMTTSGRLFRLFWLTVKVDDQEIIVSRVSRVGEINQPYQVSPAMPVFLVGDRDPFGEHPVKGFVVGYEFRGVEPQDLFDCIVSGLRGNVGVDSGDGRLQTVQQQHVFKGVPFRCVTVRGNGGTMDVGVPLGLQELDGMFLNGVFSDFFHAFPLC